MMTISKVLVATDLGAPADIAIRQGHAWALEAGAELVVCHVIPQLLRNNVLFPQQNEQEALALVDLEDRAARAVSERVTMLTGREPDAFRVIIDLGAPDASIVRKAEEIHADLVVVATRSMSGLERVLLGSVADRVVRYAHCSVLVARSEPATGHVLAATDLSDAALPAVTAAVDAARARGARLTVMHSLDSWPVPTPAAALALSAAGFVPPRVPDEARAATRDALVALLAEMNITADVVVTEGGASAAIISEAEKLPAELVVVATHGRTGLRRMAIGSTAETVIRAAHCSVLVVRAARTV